MLSIMFIIHEAMKQGFVGAVTCFRSYSESKSLLKSVTWYRWILCVHTQTHYRGSVCVYTVYTYFEAQKVTVVEFFEIMMHSCGVPRWPMRVTFLLRLMLSRYSPWWMVGLVSPLTYHELMPLMHCLLSRINASFLYKSKFTFKLTAKFYAQCCLDRCTHDIRVHSLILENLCWTINRCYENNVSVGRHVYRYRNALKIFGHLYVRRNVGNDSDIRHCGSVIEGEEGRKKWTGMESEVVLAATDNRPNDNVVSIPSLSATSIFSNETRPFKKKEEKKDIQSRKKDKDWPRSWLNLAKASAMRVTIPIDLSTRPFIPLPHFLNSRRVPPLHNQSLVLIP